MLNQYGGKCSECGEYVLPGKGLVKRLEQPTGRAKWATRHIECPMDEDERDHWEYEMAMETRRIVAQQEAALRAEFAANPDATIQRIVAEYWDAERQHPGTMDYLGECIKYGGLMKKAVAELALLGAPSPQEIDKLVVAAFDNGERGKTTQSAWYDHTPVTLAPLPSFVDRNMVWGALHRSWYRPGLSGWSVGGYCSVGSVIQNENGRWVAEQTYHIGD